MFEKDFESNEQAFFSVEASGSHKEMRQAA